jgi:spermidine/putrescine transport system substrate-binding protein
MTRSNRRSSRVWASLAVLAAMSLVAAACSSNSSSSAGGSNPTATATAPPTGTLRLFSYSDGFAPAYMKAFRQQYPDVNLVTSAFGNGDGAVAKLQAGFQADVVNSCVDENTLTMVQNGLYQPLDVSRIPDWKNVFPAMKTLPGVQVDGKVYMIPVDAGTAGIMYNADVITTPPTSWTDLFNPAYKGKASIEDNSTTAIDIGALANGITDPISMTGDQLDMVKNYLIDHKDQFRTYWQSDSDITSLYKSGEVVISSGYPGNAQILQRDGYNVKFVPAKEGQMLWTCGYGIQTGASNIDASYALLNWYLDWHQELFEAKTWSYQVANELVLQHAPAKIIQQASLDAPYSYQNAIPASPPADRQAWTQAWIEVKAS